MNGLRNEWVIETLTFVGRSSWIRQRSSATSNRIPFRRFWVIALFSGLLVLGDTFGIYSPEKYNKWKGRRENYRLHLTEEEMEEGNIPDSAWIFWWFPLVARNWTPWKGLGPWRWVSNTRRSGRRRRRIRRRGGGGGGGGEKQQTIDWVCYLFNYLLVFTIVISSDLATFLTFRSFKRPKSLKLPRISKDLFENCSEKNEVDRVLKTRRPLMVGGGRLPVGGGWFDSVFVLLTWWWWASGTVLPSPNPDGIALF